MRQDDGLDALPKVARAQLQHRHLPDELAVRRRANGHRPGDLLGVDLLVDLRQGRCVDGTETGKPLSLAPGERGEGVENLLDGSAAVPERLVCGRLEDGLGEEGVELSALADEVVDNGAGARGLAHGSHASSVTADKMDVVLHPLQGGSLVPGQDVSNVLPSGSSRDTYHNPAFGVPSRSIVVPARNPYVPSR